MKKFFASLLGVLLLTAIIIGVFAVILLADAGLLHLLGVRYDSFGWLLAYVAISAVVGIPLELFTNGLARALFSLGWADRRQANLLYIPLDTFCSAFVFWLVDLFLPQVRANGFAILVTGLIFAVLSQRIERVGKGRAGRNGVPENGAGQSDE